ncbi:hypothetical protein SS50377_22965 [Spironucleus salmonicida]|uniref:Uncharacterized protein n=1 Tax=Spironucleus salmonicida TaxID=348837 RepID=V6M3V2_9EUKA|nr:hypothetical protein SS50377_22965 [Spironucleus salmonicida]|eukprot:EST47989.1 Hypothetical protein SS50377_11907 [Spironucleus salmonicida]
MGNIQSCFVDVTELQTKISQLSTPEPPRFPLELFRFQFRRLTTSTLSLHKAASRLAHFLSVQPAQIEQQFHKLSENVELNEKDFLGIAYVVFRAVSDTASEFCWLDYDFDGYIDRRLILEFLGTKYSQNCEEEVLQVCAKARQVSQVQYELICTAVEGKGPCV